MLAIPVGIHIGYRSGIPVANMTNVHISTYLHREHITYAYLDIPMGQITLHLSPGFTSHPLNCLLIRRDRTRQPRHQRPPGTGVSGGNLPSRPMDRQGQKREGDVRSYGDAMPSLSGTPGGTVLFSGVRSAWSALTTPVELVVNATKQSLCRQSSGSNLWTSG